MFENSIPDNAVVLGYSNFEFVFLHDLLMMIEDSLNVLRSDDELYSIFLALRNRVSVLCDFPESSRNFSYEVVCLDVD